MHLFDFLQHHAGVDYHPVAQHAHLPVIQYPGRQQPQFIGHVVNHYGVSRIGAAAVAHYRVRFLRQVINNFTFSFIAPLGADYNN